ncbi:MAG TPA: DnaA N-terminal domain-containing protein [Chloroflexota bacterium]|nr:DnaA N-terminal domain-containing protein [Chloroflexota bacterium]
MTEQRMGPGPALPPTPPAARQRAMTARGAPRSDGRGPGQREPRGQSQSRSLPPSAAPAPGVAGVPGAATQAAADARYRFLSRFGATILSGGIAAIPMSLYHYQAELGLVPQEVWFVGYILAHRWTAALPYPSLRQMSRRTGISTQMLHRYKQSLIEKGYLATISRHRPSGGRTSNFYDFSGLFIRLEQLLRRDRRDDAWRPTADEPDFAEPHDLADEATTVAEQLDDALDPAQTLLHHQALEPAHAAHAAHRPHPPQHEAAAGDAAVSALPTTNTRKGVPQSQRDAGPTTMSWGDVVTGVRQRRLSSPRQPQLTGPHTPALPAGSEPQGPAPDRSTDPPESKNTPSEDQYTQTHARGVTGTPARASRNVAHAPDEARHLVPATTAGRAASVGANGVNDLHTPSIPGGGPQADAARPGTWWERTRATLSQSVSPAAFNAWLCTLEPLTDSPPAPQAPVVLTCQSAFQRDHVERRYRRALETALGAPVTLVVRPPAAG